MTDEQWLWIFANMALDNDEELDDMCDDCKHEVTSKRTKCKRCGKPLSGNDENVETFVSDNFDMERYMALKNGTYELPDEFKKSTEQENDENIDLDLLMQLNDD